MKNYIKSFFKDLGLVEKLIVIAIILIGSVHYYIVNFTRPELKSIENEFQSKLVINNNIEAKIKNADVYYNAKYYDYYVFTEHGKLFLITNSSWGFNRGSERLYNIALKNKYKVCSFKVKEHWWYGWSATSISNCK